MQVNKVNELLLFYKNQVPDDRLLFLKMCFLKLNEDTANEILATRLKSPRITLLYAITLGFFGADRFYIGDIIGGIQKLLFGWLTLGIWPLVDIFLTRNLCKEANFEILKEKLRQLEE